MNNKRITVKDLMRISGFSRDTIMKLASQGKLPHQRDMNNWRIFEPECLEIVKKYGGVK